MNSVSPRGGSPPPSEWKKKCWPSFGPRKGPAKGLSFLVNKSQDGGQRGVGEAAWPPCGFDGSIPALLGEDEEGTIGRCRGGRETDGLRTAPVAIHRGAARHYRAPKHTSCIIPPMLLCFLQNSSSLSTSPLSRLPFPGFRGFPISFFFPFFIRSLLKIIDLCSSFLVFWILFFSSTSFFFLVKVC